MNILEEFWYGSIEPAEYDISSSKEYKEPLQLISRNEDKLPATMTDEQKELFTVAIKKRHPYGCLFFMAIMRLERPSRKLTGGMFLGRGRVPEAPALKSVGSGEPMLLSPKRKTEMLRRQRSCLHSGR